MRQEYLKHRFPARKVQLISYPVYDGLGGVASGLDGGIDNGAIRTRKGGQAYRLLFVGRTVALKGGEVLLDALPQVLCAIRQPLHVEFVGDEPERGRWQRKATL
jgi:hypothetical protein